MIDVVRALLESSPLLALFLAIAAGYAIGQISIAGVSFGAGAVLFTGLLIGAVAPKAAPPAMVGTLGLVMLVYGVGVQYGAQFFASLRAGCSRAPAPARQRCKRRWPPPATRIRRSGIRSRIRSACSVRSS
jgi:hypothetical protein